HAGKCQLMQGIFQKENTDKALKYGIYRHLPTYEKIIRNLVSFSVKSQINIKRNQIVCGAKEHKIAEAIDSFSRSKRICKKTWSDTKYRCIIYIMTNRNYTVKHFCPPNLLHCRKHTLYIVILKRTAGFLSI
ncbi:hypothetical protein MKC72_18670, partial [[Clostridium] innocuum]|nr:hypothetical protein [[Clostridium] innocuum]